MVWRSVRAGGDTKTRKSRRTLALPLRCVSELRAHQTRQAAARRLAGDRWQDNDLVFASEVGTSLCRVDEQGGVVGPVLQPVVGVRLVPAAVLPEAERRGRHEPLRVHVAVLAEQVVHVAEHQVERGLIVVAQVVQV